MNPSHFLQDGVQVLVGVLPLQLVLSYVVVRHKRQAARSRLPQRQGLLNLACVVLWELRFYLYFQLRQVSQVIRHYGSHEPLAIPALARQPDALIAKGSRDVLVAPHICYIFDGKPNSQGSGHDLIALPCFERVHGGA